MRFVYINMRIAAGRSAAAKKRAGDAVLDKVQARFAARSSRRVIGVTLQIDESPGQVYDAKHSNLHPLFKKYAPAMLLFARDLIAQLAAELHESEKSRVQVEHFSKRFPGMTVEDGYAVSRAWVKMKIAEGRVARGHKIGLTSRAMQQSSQIDEPDYGTLLDDMFFEPGDIPRRRFIAPRVEVELAFVLNRSAAKAQRVGVEDVLDATDYVTPAIEIIDARIEQFDRHTKAMRKVQDTISDNAANAGIVLGRAQNATRANWTCRGSAPSCARTAWSRKPGWPPACQGHPAIGVAWLAMKLAPWGESPGARRGGAGRLVHAAGGRPAGRRVRRRLRPAGPLRIPFCLKRSVPCNHPSTPSSRRCARSAPRSACGWAWPTTTPPRSARAPASTGC